MSQFKPGDLVEWEPLYAKGTMRGRVTRVTCGTVFLVIQRRNNRRKKVESEVFFEPTEVYQLRLANRPAPTTQRRGRG